MKLHLKHPIFNILSAYNDIEEFYVCGGYAMMEFLKMLRRSSKALFGEDK